MHLEVTLTIKCKLRENGRKLTFFRENPILSILGARKGARTGMMV